MNDLRRPQVLLLGDPSARPDGLERVLVRGGFQVTEADTVPQGRPAGPLPDLVLITAPDASPELEEELNRLRSRPWESVATLVVLGTSSPEAATRVITQGASDAMVAPLHLPELVARAHARVRGRVDLHGMREASEQRELLFDILQEASSSLRADEVISTLVRRVGEALGVARCSFVLTTDGDQVGRVAAVLENPTVRDLQVDLSRYPEIQEALRTEAPVHIGDIQDDPLFAAARQQWSEQGISVGIRSVLALPVNLHGRTSGVFLLRTGLEDEPLSPPQIAFARTIAQAAGRLLETEERRAGIYRRQLAAAATDPLTGCGSLDALDRRIREEFERARRYSLSFCLILLDVDGLHAINQQYGTGVGDRVLTELCGILQGELRAPDFVARYGGDEFALILPETDLEGARRSINRVRERIAAHPFPELPENERPRLSAGIVAFPHPSAMQTEDLFALVEAALLRGKSQTEERIGTAESVAA